MGLSLANRRPSRGLNTRTSNRFPDRCRTHTAWPIAGGEIHFAGRKYSNLSE